MKNFILIFAVCCAILKDTFGSNTMSEKDRKYFLEHNPANPPQNENCGDLKLMAADIVACENNKHPVKESDDMDLYTTKHIHRRRRVTAHWLAWPKHSDGNVYIPYQYATSLQNVTQAFEQAIQDFNRLTCIRLVPRQSSDRAFINLFSGAGCYTFLGRRGGSQDLSLQAYTGCAQKGVAIHEIMHVLGFYHEMARRDRDDHITIHFNNIYTSRWRQFNMHAYGNGSVWGEEYDLKSIMHYGNYGFAINTNSPTITSKRNPSEILGQRNGMSRKDQDQINKMYKCSEFVNEV